MSNDTLVDNIDPITGMMTEVQGTDDATAENNTSSPIIFEYVIIVYTVHIVHNMVGSVDIVMSIANADLSVFTELFVVHDRCALVVDITDK